MILIFGFNNMTIQVFTNIFLCLTFSVFFSRIYGEEIAIDQRTLIVPVSDNAISIINDEVSARILINITYVKDLEVLYGFAIRDENSAQLDVLRKITNNGKMSKLNEVVSVVFEISHKDILSEFPGAASITTKSPKQNIFEGGLYQLKLNLENRFCEVFDKEGRSIGVLDLIVGEPTKGPVFLRYLIDGKLPPEK